jgi:hypothetical protein
LSLRDIELFLARVVRPTEPKSEAPAKEKSEAPAKETSQTPAASTPEQQPR